MQSIISSIVVLSTMCHQAESHGFLSNPKPRQYRPSREDKPMGIIVPGSEDFGEFNHMNLNAGIGGGPAGAQREKEVGHGLCGDIGTRKAFESGIYGATAPRLTALAGGTLSTRVTITAYHGGWFEFRLCDPGPDGIVTQECLNKHVLEIDNNTPYYPQILDYASVDSGFKCTSTSYNTFWPTGSCCNGGGDCSAPNQNKDRYVLKSASGGGSKDYDIVLKIPDGISCENCILQWFYQTGNSRDAYPESFWNCADIAVSSGGSDSNTSPTTQPPTNTSPTTQPPTNTSPTTQPPTNTPSTNGDSSSNTGCNQCQGCWRTSVTPETGCYDWDYNTCDNYKSEGYTWCDGTSTEPSVSTSTPAPTTTLVAPKSTSPTSSPSIDQPQDDTITKDCGTCDGCLWAAAYSSTDPRGCYKDWKQNICELYTASGYLWCGN